jgi:hypothetical protein
VELGIRLPGRKILGALDAADQILDERKGRRLLASESFLEGLANDSRASLLALAGGGVETGGESRRELDAEGLGQAFHEKVPR